MKITMFCEACGRKNNGTTIATMNLLEHLKKKEHEVTVVICEIGSKDQENCYVMPKINLGRLCNKIIEKNGVELTKYDDEIATKAIENADVVYVNFPSFMTCKAVQRAKEMGKPVIAGFHCQAQNFTAHIGMMNCKAVNKKVYKVFYDHMYKYCDVIHFPTRFIKEEFEKNIKKQVCGEVISNGVSPEFFSERKVEKQEKFTIICSGRFSKEKAQQTLLKAVAKSQYKDKIKIILAGDGPRKKNLQKIVDKNNLDCEMGFFTREELIEKLHSAHLYVHTSIAEIEAIACMEAIVCGLVPIICNSDQSATRYFALDENSLFEPYNADQLKDKIERFYQNPMMLKRYEEKYAKNKNAFSLEECMDKMEKVFIELKEGAR